MENQAVEHSQRLMTTLTLLDELGSQLERSFTEQDQVIDEDRCYLMQIEQLKRENNFLKRKIAELTRPPKGCIPAQKRHTVACGKTALVAAEPQSNYIITFFQEITRLLQSFSGLFRLEVGQAAKGWEKQNQEISGLTAQKTEEIGHRLGRMLLQPEEKRYGLLLEIFESYYVQERERQGKLRQRVEAITTTAIDLGKRMVENVRRRERVRSSHLFMHGEDFSLLQSSMMKENVNDSQFNCDKDK